MRNEYFERRRDATKEEIPVSDHEMRDVMEIPDNDQKKGSQADGGEAESEEPDDVDDDMDSQVVRTSWLRALSVI